MIHIDLRQPLANGLRGAILSPLPLLKAAVRDPLLLAAAAVLAGSGASIWLLEQRLTRLEQEQLESVAQVNQEYTQEKAVIERAERLRGQRERLEGVVSAIESLDHDRFAFVRFLDEVATQIPENSWIEGARTVAYNAESGAVEFHLRGFSPAVEAVSAFQRALEASGDVAGTRLTGTGSVRVGAVPVVRFEITGRAGTFAAPDPGYAEGVETVASSRS